VITAPSDHKVVLRVSHLSKTFKVYSRPADMLLERLMRRQRHRTIRALRDVSFELKRGEAVGVIGRNGAGKTTLLKILAGILVQEQGTVEMRGKQAAILELGMGFHPDFTGRRNIYIGGMCLGMHYRDIERNIDAIIDFSELHDSIDLPVKTYSSGMQARLMFSIAFSVEPEILIVDEALATGDIAFVEKCIRRIEQIIRSGCTVLLVSHNTNLLARLARRAICLDYGCIVADGPSESVIKQYEINMYAQTGAREAFHADEHLGDQKVRVLDVRLRGQEVQDGIFVHGTYLAVEVDVYSFIESETANFYIAIHRMDGLCVWTATNSQHLNANYQSVATKCCVKPGRHRVTLRIERLPLNSGSYYLDVGIEPYPNVATVGEYHDYLPRCCKFSIVREDSLILHKICDTPSSWTICAVGASEARYVSR